MTIGVPASDWHSGNPDLHPRRWIAGFIGAVVIYVALLATVVSLIKRRLR